MIDYRQSGIDYREADYTYQGVKRHALTAAITHKVPQPELVLSITNVTGSSPSEENAQDTLELLVGV